MEVCFVSKEQVKTWEGQVDEKAAMAQGVKKKQHWSKDLFTRRYPPRERPFTFTTLESELEKKEERGKRQKAEFEAKSAELAAQREKAAELEAKLSAMQGQLAEQRQKTEQDAREQIEADRQRSTTKLRSFMQTVERRDLEISGSLAHERLIKERALEEKRMEAAERQAVEEKLRNNQHEMDCVKQKVLVVCPEHSPDCAALTLLFVFDSRVVGPQGQDDATAQGG